MKTLFAAVSAIGLLASTSAFAAESEVEIKATVAAACGLGNHVNGGNTTSPWNQDDIVIAELADGNGQFAGATFNNRSFGNVWCNGPASVTVTAASLVNGTRGVAPADAGSFSNEFDLSVTGLAGVYVNGASLSLNTTGATGIASVTGGTPGAFESGSGQYSGFSVQVLNPANLRPVAGSYTGYVRFTAAPAS